MLEKLSRRFAKAGYLALGLEIVVVILGILIAFQIDRWAEDRRDRKLEQNYLVRLHEDLRLEIDSIDASIRFAGSRLAAVVLLEQAIKDPEIVADNPDAIPVAIEKATWRSFPQINAFVYTELQNTGHLALIRSESLRRDLADHYASFRHYSRVGLERHVQNQFELLTAGILSTSELRHIENGSWSGTSANVSVERATEIIQDFMRRPDAVRLLPNIAQHHAFNLRVMELLKRETQDKIRQIEALLEAFDG